MIHLSKLTLYLVLKTKNLIIIDKSYFFINLFILISINCFSQKIIFRGDEISKVNQSFTFDLNDSTYTYKQNLTEGCERFEYKSEGKFIIYKDTLMLISKMPENEFLPGHIHNLNSQEINKNKFSYIYPINDFVEKGFIKIYFDNLAKPDQYKAFTLNKNKLVPLKIIQIVKLENQTILKTDNGSITLLNYITIEKPKNNILIINSIADLNTSDSYLFNLNKIPFSSFHFYTRVYRTYYFMFSSNIGSLNVRV